MVWCLLAGVGGAWIITLALVLGGRNVVFGSSNVTLRDEGVSAAVLARRVHEAGAAQPVTDDELRAVAAKLRASAVEGDPRAALFLFELAKAQRESPAP